MQVDLGMEKGRRWLCLRRQKSHLWVRAISLSSLQVTSNVVRLLQPEMLDAYHEVCKVQRYTTEILQEIKKNKRNLKPGVFKMKFFFSLCNHYELYHLKSHFQGLKKGFLNYMNAYNLQ